MKNIFKFSFYFLFLNFYFLLVKEASSQNNFENRNLVKKMHVKKNMDGMMIDELALKSPVEINEVDVLLNNKFWFIDSNINIVRVSILFKGAGIRAFGNEALHEMVNKLIFSGAGKFSKEELEKTLYRNAINISFSYSKDDAVFSFSCDVNKIEKTLEILSSIMTQPHLKKTEFKRAFDGLLISYEAEKKDPKTILINKSHEIAYGEKNCYAVSVEKNITALKHLNTQKIKDYMKSFFTQENAVVFILGPNDKTEFLKNKILSTIKKLSKKFVMNQEFEPHNFQKVNDVEIEHEIPQTMICGIMNGFSSKDVNFIAKEIALNIFGGATMFSRIFNEVRNKQGLAYYCSAQNKSSDELSQIIFINSGTIAASAEETKKIIKEEIKKMHESGVTNEEFLRAKKTWIENLICGGDSTLEIISFVLKSRMSGFSVKEIMSFAKKVNDLTILEVNIAAKEIMNVDNLSFVSIGEKVEEKT